MTHIWLVGLPESVAAWLCDRLSRMAFGNAFLAVGYRDQNGHLVESHSEYIKKARERVSKEIDGGQGGSTACVLDLSKSFAESIHEFVFPSLPVVKLPLEPRDLRTKQQKKAFVASTSNDISRLLKPLHAYLNMLRSEVEKTNSTPFLLPLSNFRSEELEPTLRNLTLVNASDLYHVRVTGLSKELKAHANFGKRGGNHFIDTGGMKFFTPGRAKHGGHYPPLLSDTNHFIQCLLGSRYRLGTRINAGFHYDCQNCKPTQDGRCLGCHGQTVDVGRPKYLNIYPNDYIRPPKK